MKSLEIVNNYIDLFNIPSNRSIYTNQQIKEMETIKQDLEVLEIIRKKKVDVNYLNVLCEEFEKNETILAIYNDNTLEEKELTLEELLKLKQWLEVNENETVL